MVYMKDACFALLCHGIVKILGMSVQGLCGEGLNSASNHWSFNFKRDYTTEISHTSSNTKTLIELRTILRSLYVTEIRKVTVTLYCMDE